MFELFTDNTIFLFSFLLLMTKKTLKKKKMHPKDNYTLLKINGVFVTYDTHQQCVCLNYRQKLIIHFFSYFFIVKKNLRRRKYEYIFISNKLFEVCLWNTRVYTNTQHYR